MRTKTLEQLRRKDMRKISKKDLLRRVCELERKVSLLEQKQGEIVFPTLCTSLPPIVPVQYWPPNFPYVGDCPGSAPTNTCKISEEQAKAQIYNEGDLNARPNTASVSCTSGSAHSSGPCLGNPSNC